MRSNVSDAIDWDSVQDVIVLVVLLPCLLLQVAARL